MDLNIAGGLVGVTAGDLVMLNPELNQTATPPGNYQLRIPQGTETQFKERYALLLPSERRVQVLAHRVKQGDSLWMISKKYSVKTSDILSANNLSQRRAHHLRIGQNLVIPGGKGVSSSLVAAVLSDAVSVKKNT